MTTAAQTRREKRTATATAGCYWIPTRPYTLVDAVNRGAAATGNLRHAMLAADALYNGHAVTVMYNEYHDYCICEHFDYSRCERFWGDRVVHCRGSMESALRAGRHEYDLGHRGTSVRTCNLTPEEADVAQALGYVPWSEEIEKSWSAAWYTELHGCVGEALDDARFCGDTVHLLLQASSKIDYHERKERASADRLFGVGMWKESRLVGPAGERALMLSGSRGGAEHARIVVDGKSKLSGPAPTAREWWEKQIAAGWVLTDTGV